MAPITTAWHDRPQVVGSSDRTKEASIPTAKCIRGGCPIRPLDGGCTIPLPIDKERDIGY